MSKELMIVFDFFPIKRVCTLYTLFSPDSKIMIIFTLNFTSNHISYEWRIFVRTIVKVLVYLWRFQLLSGFLRPRSCRHIVSDMGCTPNLAVQLLCYQCKNMSRLTINVNHNHERRSGASRSLHTCKMNNNLNTNKFPSSVDDLQALLVKPCNLIKE